jgi:Ca-activated chloride channel family protein
MSYCNDRNDKLKEDNKNLMQKYQEAIEAYNKSLELEPNWADTKYNKQLVENLLKQQESESQDNSEQNNEKQQRKN